MNTFVRMITMGMVAAMVVIAEASPPNIVFIVADDMGFNEVGFRNGTRGVRTPHIDALAREGVVLDRYYTAPLCSPSRSSLMTGLYTHRIGTQANVIYWDTPWAPDPNLVFLPAHLKALAGYGATALFGKWHLGMHTPAALPTRRGFDAFRGFLQGGGSHGTHVAACVGQPPDPFHDDEYVCPGPGPGPGPSLGPGPGPGPGLAPNPRLRPSMAPSGPPAAKDFRGYDWFWGEGVADFGANGTGSTALITQSALEFIGAHSGDAAPYFLMLPFQAVHEPIACRRDSYDLFADVPGLSDLGRLLLGYIWELDEAVGAITAAVQDTPSPRDTVIVFVSDNGAPPELGAGGRNWPLAGFKSQTWEGGVRVPAVVHAPALFPGGVSRAQYVHVVDWAPTLLGLAGVPSDAIASLGMDGLDVSATLAHGTAVRKEFVVNVNPLCGAGQMGPPKAAYVAGDLKLLCFCFGVRGIDNATSTGCRGPMLLYNITADPGETTNLLVGNAEVAQAMEASLAAHVDASVPPMQWTPPYQGPTYQCAACPLHPTGTGPFVPWGPWIGV